MEKACILFVDDEKHNLTAFKSAFRRNYDVFLANSAEEGLKILRDNPIKVIITDQRMPGMTGIELLEKIIPTYPNAIRMILTGFSDVEAIINAINTGQVYRYITKPWNKNELKITIDNALEAYHLREENKTLIQNLQAANEGLEDKVQKRTQEIEQYLGIVKKQWDGIQASISYAQRIQTAILPLEETLCNALPQHFIFYRPRDIVSGDFYWFKEVGKKQFLVAADCTGHGVPGAFMTMLGAQALANIILQNNVHSPDQILSALDDTLQALLQSKSTLLRDGMDISVCVIDKHHKTLHFAGAVNPLIVIQNNEMQVLKSSRYSINGHRPEGQVIEFPTHKVDLAIDTTFYIFSDGLQDQFGGEQNRKFSSKRLRNTLLENYPKPIQEQNQLLAQAIDEWQGEFEQIDDMLLIGVRMKLEDQ